MTETAGISEILSEFNDIPIAMVLLKNAEETGKFLAHYQRLMLRT